MASARDALLPTLADMLRARDETMAPARVFVEDYQAVMVEQERLRKELTHVERERDSLMLRLGVGDVRTSVETEQKLRDYEDQLHKLQSQLTDAYKKNNDNVEKLLAAHEREQEARVWKERATEAIATTERLQRELTERDASLHTMRDEVHAVQARLVEKEKRLKELEQENGLLIERWLSYKNDEVNRINAQNAAIKDQLQAQQLQAKQQQALVEQGKQIMSAENKGKASMLDNGPAVAAGGGAEARLPTMARREVAAHQGEANCVSFSFNGARFCTGGADNRVKVWDTRSATVVTQLSGSTASIMSANFSTNDAFIVGAACDNTARVWDLNMGRQKHALTGHIGKVYAGVFTADASKVVTGAHDRTVKIWDMPTGNTLKTIFCFSSCNDVCVTEAYQAVCSAHLDGVLRLWDMRTGDLAHEFKDVHTKQITSVSVGCMEEPMLLTSSRDNLLKVWDLRKNAVLMTLKDEAYRSGLNWSRACWSPDGKYVAAGGAEGSLFVWSVADGALVKQLGSESSATISCVAWNPDGQSLLATDRKSKLITFA